MKLVLFSLSLLGVACGPPEAPETLDDLSSFLFEHVWDEDEAYLEVGIANLSTWLETNFEATHEGYSVQNLSQEAVESLEGDERYHERFLSPQDDRQRLIIEDYYSDDDESVCVLFPMAFRLQQ